MDRKAEIVSLAEELIQKGGYGGFSYSDLSKALGIAKASIHHHFPSKEDLGLAVIRSLDERTDHVVRQIDSGDRSSWQKLDWYLDYGRGMVEKDKSLICPVNALQIDVDVIPETMRQALGALEQRELDFLTGVLDLGRQRGEMSFQGPARERAMMVLAAFKGALQFARDHGAQFFYTVIDQLKVTLRS